MLKILKNRIPLVLVLLILLNVSILGCSEKSTNTDDELKKYIVKAELGDAHRYLQLENYYIQEGTKYTWSFNISKNNIGRFNYRIEYGNSLVEGENDKYQLKLIPPENSGIDDIVKAATASLAGISFFDTFYFDNTSIDHRDFQVYIRATSKVDAIRRIHPTYSFNNMIGTWHGEMFWIGDGENNLDFGETISVWMTGIEIYFVSYELNETVYFPE